MHIDNLVRQTGGPCERERYYGREDALNEGGRGWAAQLGPIEGDRRPQQQKNETPLSVTASSLNTENTEKQSARIRQRDQLEKRFMQEQSPHSCGVVTTA